MQIHKETEAGGSKNTDSTDVEGKDELLAVELKDGILEGLGVSLVEELGMMMKTRTASEHTALFRKWKS